MAKALRNMTDRELVNHAKKQLSTKGVLSEDMGIELRSRNGAEINGIDWDVYKHRAWSEGNYEDYRERVRVRKRRKKSTTLNERQQQELMELKSAHDDFLWWQNSQAEGRKRKEYHTRAAQSFNEKGKMDKRILQRLPRGNRNEEGYRKYLESSLQTEEKSFRRSEENMRISSARVREILGRMKRGN